MNNRGGSLNALLLLLLLKTRPQNTSSPTVMRTKNPTKPYPRFPSSPINPSSLTSPISSPPLELSLHGALLHQPLQLVLGARHSLQGSFSVLFVFFFGQKDRTFSGVRSLLFEEKASLLGRRQVLLLLLLLLFGARPQAEAHAQNQADCRNPRAKIGC